MDIGVLHTIYNVMFTFWVETYFLVDKFILLYGITLCIDLRLKGKFISWPMVTGDQDAFIIGFVVDVVTNGSSFDIF